MKTELLQQKIDKLEELVRVKQGYIDILIGDYEDEESFAYKTMFVSQETTNIESDLSGLDRQIEGEPEMITSFDKCGLYKNFLDNCKAFKDRGECICENCKYQV